MRTILSVVAGAAIAAGLFSGAGPLQAQSPGTTEPSGFRVNYGPGWELLGVPNGSTIPAPAPYFTWQPSSGAYDPATTTQAGKGYWVYFPVNATAVLNETPSSGQSMTVTLPAGQWILIGNPYTVVASIAGADAFFSYNARGYQNASILLPGYGAWAYSTAGGTAVITACVACTPRQ
jgi:hypothetical protein